MRTVNNLREMFNQPIGTVMIDPDTGRVYRVVGLYGGGKVIASMRRDGRTAEERIDYIPDEDLDRPLSTQVVYEG